MLNALTSKHGLTSQFSCQYSHPYTLTAQLSPLNFDANTLTSKYGLTLMLSLLSSHLSIFMLILSPLNFHAKCSHLQA